MACVKYGRQRSRRHGKAKPAKWAFELELEELELPAALSCSGDSGIHTSSSEEGSDSGTGGVMPPISRFILEGSKLETKINQVNHHDRGTFLEREGGYPDGPHALPFTPNNFLSSTMLKKLPPPTGSKRRTDHHTRLAEGTVSDISFLAHRGADDRFFQYEALRSLDGRDRLLAEMEYLDHLRGIKRHRREVVPHRAHLNLFLGGKKIEVEERFDLNREIQRLKAMTMPVKARDLYHGRGIVLPPTHMSVNPRQGRVPLSDLDLDDDLRRNTAQPTVQRSHHTTLTLEPQLATLEKRIHLSLDDSPRTRSFIKGKRPNHLPSIGKLLTSKPVSDWRGRGSPILLAKEKRTVTNLQARLHLSRLPRDDTSLSRSQPSIAHSNRSAPWVENQNHVKKGRKGEQERAAPLPLLPQAVTLPTAGPQKSRSPEAPPPTQKGMQINTPSPLKAGMDVDVSEEQMSSLRQTFQRLDTDMDGHLQYHQLQSQLPKEFSHQQENFVKQVYTVTHSSAEFFGVDEFLLMNQLTTRVASLTGPAHEAYGKLEFDSLEKSIISYVDLFHNADSAQRGRISADALRELIGKSQNSAPLKENSTAWNTIMDSIELDTSSQVSRMEYLAHLPLFLTLVPPALP